MSAFGYVVSILMLILGLGITELLKDVVDAFRNRKTTPLDWLPLLWAAIVFVEQMQFLWAIFELRDLIHSWTAEKFVVMLFLALLLFSAGALVVPRIFKEGKSAWQIFQQNGRWTLAVLAVYYLVAFLINPPFFGIAYFDPYNILNLLLSVFLVLLLFAWTRKAWVWGTIVYVVLATTEIILLSPEVYQ